MPLEDETPQWQEFECRGCGYQVVRSPVTDEPPLCTICLLMRDRRNDEDDHVTH